MTEEFQDSIKKWASKQSDSPSLAAAIRRLVELGLTVIRVLSVAPDPGTLKMPPVAQLPASKESAPPDKQLELSNEQSAPPPPVKAPRSVSDLL